DQGALSRLQGVMVNFTELKEAETALREESRALEVLYRTGTLVAGELDMERLAQTVTDAGKQVTGAQFGAFSYKVEGNGHSHGQAAGGESRCYSSADTPRELLEWVPQSPRSAFVPGTRAQHDALRIDDVLRDPRAPGALVEAERKSPAPAIR